MKTKWILPDGALKMEFELNGPDPRTGIVEINNAPDHPGNWDVDITETTPDGGGFYFGARDMTIPNALEYAKRAVKLLNELHSLPDRPEFM